MPGVTNLATGNTSSYDDSSGSPCRRHSSIPFANCIAVNPWLCNN
jgi:hypothetical protein